MSLTAFHLIPDLHEYREPKAQLDLDLRGLKTARASKQFAYLLLQSIVQFSIGCGPTFGAKLDDPYDRRRWLHYGLPSPKRQRNPTKAYTTKD
jgi:hypothetical protein